MSIMKLKNPITGLWESILAIKGEKGSSVQSVVKTSTAGKVDTYTMTFDDGNTYTFTVTNGEDGQGTGDMSKSVYDTNDNGKVDEAEAVAWSGVTDKPSTFTPSSHTHTKSEVTDFSHTHTKSEVTDFSHTHTKSEVTDFPTLADVATSGSYDDLSNKPTIPSEVTESTVSGWGFTKNTGTYIKPSGGIPASDLAESYAASSHTHTLSGVTDITATATELNLLDGATSDNLRKVTVSTTDIGVGGTLTTDELYFVYEE